MEEKVINLLEKIFNVNLTGKAYSDITPDSIEYWDSVGHLNLIVALEEEFDIVFEPEEIEEMLDGFNSVISTLKKKV